MKDDGINLQGPPILSGWKEIATYLGKGVRTVQRYERLLGLPVRRPAGKPWGSVVATRVEIDAWVAASQIREGLHLLRPATNSSAATWLRIQKGAAQMNMLAKQMKDLRAELRNSVRLLRESIREVSDELNRDEWDHRVRQHVSQSKLLLNLLDSDSGKRKAS